MRCASVLALAWNPSLVTYLGSAQDEDEIDVPNFLSFLPLFRSVAEQSRAEQIDKQFSSSEDFAARVSYVHVHVLSFSVAYVSRYVRCVV